MAKHLYIIAGPNGAGKTTAAFGLLQDVLHIEHFVNADEIARGLDPFHPELVSVMAGKLMLRRIDALISQEAGFAIETTLATRSYARMIQKVHELGYKCHLVFFWLENAEQAKERVKTRVAEGGHNIPEPVIERRYERGIHNLIHVYLPICDEVLIVNNTVSAYITTIAEKKSLHAPVSVREPEIWERICAAAGQ